jgi:hypothetical protein
MELIVRENEQLVLQIESFKRPKANSQFQAQSQLNIEQQHIILKY